MHWCGSSHQAIFNIFSMDCEKSIRVSTILTKICYYLYTLVSFGDKNSFQEKRGSSCAFPVPEDIIGVFHFYALVVNFNHYELGLITSICACLGMTDFGTYNKSHGPPRKNTEHPDFHHGWSVGRPRIIFFVQHCNIIAHLL